jgi:glutathione synthase/RimK-type ligase-like ATP-grasp enzyme
MIALISAQPDIYSSRRFRSIFKESLNIIHPETDPDSIFPDSYSFVIPRFSKRYLDEGRNILALFEKSSIPLLTSSQAIIEFSDKWTSYLYCQQNKIEVVPTFQSIHECISSTSCADVIIKPRIGSNGEGILRLPSDKAGSFSQEHVDQCIYQPFYSESSGSDIRVLLLHGQVLGCIRRTSNSGNEFRSNYSLGGNVSSYEPSFEVHQLITSIQNTIPSGFYGVDIIETFYGGRVVEINTCPGFEAFESIHGLMIVERIRDIAQSGEFAI